MEEELKWLSQAEAAGIPFSQERAEINAGGIRRLEEAADWVRRQDLAFEEPATIFTALVERPS